MHRSTIALLAALALVPSGPVLAQTAEATAPRRPNIVFFLVDDLGWGAMGAFGSTVHETPHFDALCQRGMRFTNAYSACTVCSPSRAAILTGQYPGRINLTDYIPGQHRPKEPLKIPDWQKYLDHEHTTLAEALQQAGYRTGFFGKWHLTPVGRGRASTDEEFKQLQASHTPLDHGFDVNVGGREWGQPKGRGKYFFPFDMPGLEDSAQGDYLTDRLTDEAVEYLGETGDQPFLLYMSYYSVHGPIMGKRDDIEHFEDQPDENWPTDMGRVNPAEYAAMHKSVDDSIGRIVAKLEALGQLENTAIFFTGDNGGNWNSACGGLREFKGFAFEGGVREPTCIVWPGVTQPGSVSDTPIIGTDFYPTMLAVAGLPQMPEQHLDGKNLEPLLTGSGDIDREALYWHYPHYHRTRPYGAIRQGDWKLIEFFEDERLMLFNLKEDPGEQHDLAQAQAAKTRALHDKLKAWRLDVDAQMPTRRTQR